MRHSSSTVRRFRTLITFAALGAIGAIGALPLPALAQSVLASTASAACLDSLKPADARQWVAYVYSTTPDSSSKVVQAVADEFAQSVTQHLRVLLHARGATLPAGEPDLGWRGFPMAPIVQVTLSRLRPPHLELAPALASAPAAKLLYRAAAESQASDDAVFWTNDMAADSTEFLLGFVLSPNGNFGRVPGVRYAFPAFSLLHPIETPAKAVQMPDIPYPAEALRAGGSGAVLVRFQVDTTGHVVPTTMREEWPASQARPKGQLLSIYTDFLQSVMSALPSATFDPATIGGCRVNQWVLQPFTFDIKPRLIVR